VYLPLLDRLLYRHPFEGGSAQRYARHERRAFGDLDARLLDELDLAAVRRFLDLGCGPGTLARAARARHPGMLVVAIDPSLHRPPRRGRRVDARRAARRSDPAGLRPGARVRAWARRVADLHGELAAVADADPRWWLLAGGAAAAETWPSRASYVISDAEPDADTFIGYRAPRPRDPLAHALARARAARTAIRALDGELPDQPLAVTIHRDARAVTVASTLDVAAFAIGDRVLVATLDDPALPAQLAAVARGAAPPAWRGAPPFVCVSIGDDALATARHGHRRAWTADGGPWLGLGRAGDLATVSTCHMVVDGYGHARLAAAMAAREDGVDAGNPSPDAAWSPHEAWTKLAPSPVGTPLGVAWRELPAPVPRAIPLAYALGVALHRIAGRRDARFSPTVQIPIAPGDRDDPLRVRRRVVPAIVSVRFADGVPEPFAIFEARARAALAREADGRGLVTRLLAAARAAPAPLAWKRRGISASRPRWLDRFAEVIGGRACLSRIQLDAPAPPMCAVSSPARLASADDPLGGCVVTVLDDGTRGAITACGSGALAGTAADAGALLDELLARL